MVGLGTMGAGIAQLCIEAGVETVARDVTAEVCEQGRSRIEAFLDKRVEKGKLDAEGRARAAALLTVTTELSDLAGCDLVIEAVFEDLAVKQELFRELEAATRADAILATNTSALSVTEVAAGAGHPERVVGMHFFNPAPLMPLVEIVRAERTTEATVETAFAFAEQIGKKPVRCLDTPGFIVTGS